MKKQEKTASGCALGSALLLSGLAVEDDITDESDTSTTRRSEN